MVSAFFEHILVLVRGGGDLASGVVYRLYRTGFPVVVTELETPKLVRRAVCYGSAVYDDSITVEGITSRLVVTDAEIQATLAAGGIPVVVDHSKLTITNLQPTIVVDARMEKRNSDTTIHDAPLVVALGPGYTAGVGCHVVVETNRGHNLGRAIWQGGAEPNTGIPGKIAGQTHSRVLRAPVNGYVEAQAQIGDKIESGQIIATVNGQALTAPFRACFTWAGAFAIASHKRYENR